jgi:acetylornithine deacetylase/succinyl-diaminopimelate desuccinylase-like protein
MTDMQHPVIRLAAELVAIDSRSFVSNLAIAERVERELAGFEIERVDYTDPAGVAKRALVAHKGPKGGYALSGHLDTVPATGWESDPWAPRLDAEGMLHGLGSVDMKGQVAAAIVAAQGAPAGVPVTLLITADEETSKEGARRIAQESALAKSLGLKGIIVAEPTSLAPVRGHRSHIGFTATARGIQAHSSTGKGVNANWKLLPFLVAMQGVFDRLRSDPALQDAGYDPPFSDFNLILDNHGTAMNVTPARATAHIKFRYSAKVDPAPVLAAVREAAREAGLELAEQRAWRCAHRQAAAHRALWHRCQRVAGAGALPGARPRRCRAGAYAARMRRRGGVGGSGAPLRAGVAGRHRLSGLCNEAMALRAGFP